MVGGGLVQNRCRTMTTASRTDKDGEAAEPTKIPPDLIPDATCMSSPVVMSNPPAAARDSCWEAMSHRVSGRADIGVGSALNVARGSSADATLLIAADQSGNSITSPAPTISESRRKRGTNS